MSDQLQSAYPEHLTLTSTACRKDEVFTMRVLRSLVRYSLGFEDSLKLNTLSKSLYSVNQAIQDHAVAEDLREEAFQRDLVTLREIEAEEQRHLAELDDARIFWDLMYEWRSGSAWED